MGKLIKTIVVDVTTILVMLGLYVAFTAGVTWYLSSVYYGYDAVNGANDSEAIIVILLLWDRLFGPTARSMRQHQKLMKKKDTLDYA
jgi:hypothetical protein